MASALRLPQARSAQVAPSVRAPSLPRPQACLPAAARSLAGGAVVMAGGRRAGVAALRPLGALHAATLGGGGLAACASHAVARAGGAQPSFSRRAAEQDRGRVGGAARGARQPFDRRKLSGGRAAREVRATEAGGEPQPPTPARAAENEKEQPCENAVAAAAAVEAALLKQQADAKAAATSAKQERAWSWLRVVGVVVGSVALALLAQLPGVHRVWARLAEPLLRADVLVPLLVLPAVTLLYRAWSAADLVGSQKAEAVAAEQRLTAAFGSLRSDAVAAEQRFMAAFGSLRSDAVAAEQRLRGEIMAVKEEVTSLKAEVLQSERRTEKRIVDWANAATAMSAGHAAHAALSAQTAQAAATAAQAAADVPTL